MIRKSFLAIILFLGILSISFATGTRIGVIPWGTGDTQLGLQSGPEIEPVGPLSFAIDSDDSIYFLDSINKRISVFDSKGTHQKVIGKDVIGSSIAVTGDGTIGVKDENNLHIYYKSEKISDIPISNEVEGYGQHLRCYESSGNDYFYITQLNQNLMQVANGSKGKYSATLTRSNDITFQGFKGLFSVQTFEQTYLVEWNNKHLAYLTINKGQKINEVYPITTNDVLGGLQIIGVDSSGNVFIEVERITADNYVHLYIYKLDSNGNAIVTQEIPNDYATTVYKKNELLHDGSIMQMVTTKEGVEIWKWAL